MRNRCCGDIRVRQPEERDVVEDIVSCKAPGLSVKGLGNELVAAQVVVKYPGCQEDR